MCNCTSEVRLFEPPRNDGEAFGGLPRSGQRVVLVIYLVVYCDTKRNRPAALATGTQTSRLHLFCCCR